MTLHEIQEWLLRNGWKWYQVPSDGDTLPYLVLRIESRYPKSLGLWMCVRFLKRDMRVYVTDFDTRYHRIITATPSRVVMQGGMPRGMGLWSYDCSPLYHRRPDDGSG